MMGSLLWNSLLVAGLTSAISSFLGLIVATVTLGSPLFIKRLLVAAGVMVLALPPFLVTNTWLNLLGTNGSLRTWLPLEIHSLPGAAFILAMLLWPVPFLLTLAAWRRLESSQLDSDPALRGIALFRHLLWPMARPYLLAGTVVTFVLALNNFAVPAILQVRVLAALLWIRFNTTFDHLSALQIGWPLIVIPCLLLLLLKGKAVEWPRQSGEVSHRRLRTQLGTPWFGFCAGVAFLALLVSLLVPFAQLVASSRTWAEMPVVWRSVPGTIWNSLAWPALSATACLLLAGLTWRLRAGWLFWIPFLVPGVWLGIGIIQVFNRPLFHAVYSSFAVVILAWLIRYAAPAWAGCRLAAREMDRDLADAGRINGASGWSLWRHVHAPQIGPLAAASWYVTYLLCLWDVETLILIVPPGGETLALRIFNLLHYGHNAQVNAMCLVLVLLALAPTAVWLVGKWLRARCKRP